MHSRSHEAIAALEEKSALVKGVDKILDVAAQGNVFLVDGLLLNNERLIDFGFELMREGLFRMPFEWTTIEIVNAQFAFPAPCRLFMFCLEGNGIAMGRELEKIHRDEGQCQVAVGYFAYTADRRMVSPGLFLLDMHGLKVGELSFLCQTVDIERPVPNDEVMEMLRILRTALCAFVALINSKSAEVVVRQASEKLNKSRAKKGKRPLPDVRYVDVPRRQVGGGGAGGSHASPRMHWRRGHFRHLNDRVVPVSPCLVGVAENGVVKQVYRARRRGGS